MSEFFVALCPALDHRDSSQSLNQYTWAQRGWCRTERMVREVTAPKKALILLIESPKHLAVLPAWESNFYSPGQVAEKNCCLWGHLDAFFGAFS